MHTSMAAWCCSPTIEGGAIADQLLALPMHVMSLMAPGTVWHSLQLLTAYGSVAAGVCRQEQRRTQGLRSDMDDMWSLLCTLKQSAGQSVSPAETLSSPSLQQSSRQQKTNM